MSRLVWSIAGFSPSNCAGVTADSHTLSILGVNARTILTAVIAQNGLEVNRVEPVSAETIAAQFLALKKLGWPQIIKVGLLPTPESVIALSRLISDCPSRLVYDPIMISSSGHRLMQAHTINTIKEKWLSKVDVLTPNVMEAEALTDQKINTPEDMLCAAKKLCQMGAKQVILKGGHLTGKFAQDLWTDGTDNFWLTLPRILNTKTHGTGCLFSTALSAFLAQNYEIENAFVLAKMAVQQSIKSAVTYANRAFVKINQWPTGAENLPWLTEDAICAWRKPEFAPLKKKMGFYPIMPSYQWLEKCITWGAKTCQLRLKDQPYEHYQRSISQATLLCKQKDIQLFINDHWKLALQHHAYGVHLGQEDLNDCDVYALAESGMRIGISTHCYAELARAHAFNPSYIALGPIYPTTVKPMKFSAQGLDNLRQWRDLVTTQLVAIGGINIARLFEVMSCNIDGVSVISAITQAGDPFAACQQFLASWEGE